MKNYSFLIKPAFFIFNLLFATWLVFKIETISPSDFGKYGRIFQEEYRPPVSDKKGPLKKLYRDYKNGLLDSVSFEKTLDRILTSGGGSGSLKGVSGPIGSNSAEK
jgi:hypothetical protein